MIFSFLFINPVINVFMLTSFINFITEPKKGAVLVPKDIVKHVCFFLVAFRTLELGLFSNRYNFHPSGECKKVLMMGS